MIKCLEIISYYKDVPGRTFVHNTHNNRAGGTWNWEYCEALLLDVLCFYVVLLRYFHDYTIGWSVTFKEGLLCGFFFFFIYWSSLLSAVWIRNRNFNILAYFIQRCCFVGNNFAYSFVFLYFRWNSIFMFMLQSLRKLKFCTDFKIKVA